MRLLLLIIFLVFGLLADLSAQNIKARSFVINGSINTDTGTIKLIPVNDTGYYPQPLEEYSAQIQHGKFRITGQIPYPQAYAVALAQYHSSHFLLVDTGVQKITVNIDSIRETPRSDSRAMRDYYDYYIPAFAQIRAESVAFSAKWNPLYAQNHYKLPDSLQLVFSRQKELLDAKSDSVLQTFVTAHPNSYWGLWSLVALNNFGYYPRFDEIYTHFSNALKNTLTGKTLNEKLRFEKNFITGGSFPYIASVDTKNRKLDTDYFKKSNYTLVDFWYSHCGICISQFPELNALYAKYKPVGFNIISISTDAAKYRKNWILQIKQHKLLWAQYWDINGIETAKRSINAFPTNFLLDSAGRIVRRNLSPAELKAFLAHNLQK